MVAQSLHSTRLFLSHHRRWAMVVCVVAIFGSAVVAFGQGEAATRPTAETPTVEMVQQRLKQVEASTTLDEEAKGKVRETLQQTLKDLESAAGWAASAGRYEQMTKAVPDELEKTKTALAALPCESEVSVPEAGLTQLEQDLSEKTAALKTQKDELAELEAEPKHRADRRAKLPKLLVTLREQLAETDQQLQASPANATPSEIELARRWSLLARRQTLQNELQSYEKELDAYEKRVELLPLRRDLVAGRIAAATREIAAWREAVDRRRREEADAQVHHAQAAAAQAHPAIADLTARNAQWANRRQELSKLIVDTGRNLDATRATLSSLQDQVKRTKEKVDLVGQTSTIGQLLRNQRENLRDLRAHRKAIKNRQSTIGECQLELLEAEDRRSELSNLDAEIRNHLKATGQDGRGAVRWELEAAAREALETEKDYVDKQIVDLKSYFEKLVDLAVAEEQLTKEANEYAKYIDERVLWIHSTSALNISSAGQIAGAASWLSRPEAWLRMGSELASDAISRPIPAVVAVLVFGPLVWNQRRLRRKASEIGAAAGKATCSSIMPTLEAVVVTILLSAVMPGAWCYIAWRLNVAGGASDLTEAVAVGLAFTAGIYLVLDLMQQMCRPGGLSEAHFDWPVASLKPVRKYMRIAKAAVLPCVFVTVTMASQSNNQWGDSLGRLGFVAAMIACAVLVQQALRYSGAVYQAMLAAHHDGWTDRLRLLWYPLTVCVPLALAALAATGYYYTAQQLAGRMVASVCILFGLIFLRSLLLRWILVNRRKLAMEQARARRAAAGADTKTAEENTGVSDIPTAAQPVLDLATINVQTRYLVKHSLALAGFLGIWVVWVDVLPALRIFDQVPLWSSAGQAEPTSLADLFLAMLTFATAAVAVRNAPALLELTLLQKSKLDASFRYTIAAISRYVIIVVGLLVGCHVLGLTWGTVQWLVAAVSVGLGFGLQEIFANFVSGIIILFERPVRVGDVVTIADITGVVSRIRMRATTITNWDRQEFIVPNKEFITGRLLNWTLSDQVNRVVLNVGIAYGSDTRLATELLTRIVREHPLILDEPAPRVTFEKFGDSSLNYVVRCFLPDMDKRLQVIHDLHTSIDCAFREAGIEIAFPQQDIHIRSVNADVDSFRQPPVGRRPGLVHDDGDEHGESRQVA
ncbi:MAG TPA: mechanosensitive ion channel domain-containing protein [Thermoguttaceae bacterium]|nr:mechanosensitive ion channel domain-containing protein [Thermoguttaceae bacterium]